MSSKPVYGQVLETTEGIFRPGAYGFPRKLRVRLDVRQEGKHCNGVALQLRLGAVLEQLARLAVELKRSETDLLYGWDWQPSPLSVQIRPLLRRTR